MPAINYGEIMVQALRHAVRDVLSFVEKNGLPEANHFVIDFATDHPGVELPPRLKQEHPETMRIILQNWFENLRVGDAGFWVTLSFNEVPESIYIPHVAMLRFSDPDAGVNFSFPHHTQSLHLANQDPLTEESMPDDDVATPKTAEQQTSDNVVSLDRFRKSQAAGDQ